MTSSSIFPHLDDGDELDALLDMHESAVEYCYANDIPWEDRHD